MRPITFEADSLADTLADTHAVDTDADANADVDLLPMPLPHPLAALKRRARRSNDGDDSHPGILHGVRAISYSFFRSKQGVIYLGNKNLLS